MDRQISGNTEDERENARRARELLRQPRPQYDGTPFSADIKLLSKQVEEVVDEVMKAKGLYVGKGSERLR